MRVTTESDKTITSTINHGTIQAIVSSIAAWSIRGEGRHRDRSGSGSSTQSDIGHFQIGGKKHRRKVSWQTFNTEIPNRSQLPEAEAYPAQFSNPSMSCFAILIKSKSQQPHLLPTRLRCMLTRRSTIASLMSRRRGILLASILVLLCRRTTVLIMLVVVVVCWTAVKTAWCAAVCRASVAS
jgi:hypothetical protein